MYQKHLPNAMSTNWVIAELDEANGYLEFLGYDGEFLISVMEQSYDNPTRPFHLCMNQLKGIIERFNFEELDWTEWYESAEKAVEAALKLIVWMNQNYSNFLPLTTEVLVSVGTEAQLLPIKQYYEEELKIHDFKGKALVFRKVSLLQGSISFSDSALQSLTDFTKNCDLCAEEMNIGLLTNEKFELIEDLRSAFMNRLNSLS